MTKLKTPLLSLGASQTLGDAVTFQRRSRVNFARKKPMPSQPRSLAQMYQRWDYQNAIWYWNTLTPAQKWQYRVDGLPYRLTGFAYFMRYYLRNLPDLAGRWRLDEGGPGWSYDSSSYDNNGVFFGTNPVDGKIGLARHFDGINDYIAFDRDPQLDFGTGDFTHEFFFTLEGWSATGFDPFWSNAPAPHGVQLDYKQATSEIRLILYFGGPPTILARVNPLTLNRLYHIAFRRESLQGSIVLDGTQLGATLAMPGSIGLPGGGWTMGRHLARYIHAVIDNFTIWNRPLSDAQISALSERRHPV